MLGCAHSNIRSWLFLIGVGLFMIFEPVIPRLHDGHSLKGHTANAARCLWFEESKSPYAKGGGIEQESDTPRTAWGGLPGVFQGLERGGWGGGWAFAIGDPEVSVSD